MPWSTTVLITVLSLRWILRNQCAPIGTVVVFTGILPICQDENGLAAVLGHGENSIADALELE